MSNPRGQVSPPTHDTVKALSDFIRQIDVETIYLKHADFDNNVGASAPAHGVVQVDGTAGYSNLPGKVAVSHRYDVRLDDVENEKRVLFRISVEFVVLYKSNLPMTDEVFGIFSETNLPLNTWPYLREFVASTVSRFTWTPFTLPVRVVGMPSATGQRPTETTSPSPKRTKRKSTPSARNEQADS
jgi:preprotein translocase subunit SecB